MKTVLITGGSGGIGKVAVEAFAAAGYAVAFTYNTNDAEAEKIAAQTGARAFKCRVENSQSVKETIEAVTKAFGKTDVLVNNAGIARQTLFTDISEEEWDNMINVNLKGCFLMCKAVLPEMIHRKDGVIINVSSMWGICGASCEVHYSAAKSGVIGLTKALAKEVGLSGIRVNAVAPGVIATPMNKNLSREDMLALKDEIPLNRIGTPEEVASVLLFLAGEGGRYITGQVISPNGGMVI